MSRYIYITDDCLMDIAYKHMDDNALIGLQNALEEIPTADVREVVPGEWVDDGLRSEAGNAKLYSCSNCSYHYVGFGKEFLYCPSCGARMDRER